MIKLKTVLCCCALLLTPCAAMAGGSVLFDQAHGQRLVIEDTGDLHLSKLADRITAAGASVTSSTAPLTEDALKSVSALVISGAFQPLTRDESAAVVRFVERGGRLAVLLHIAPPLVGLLQQFDLLCSSSVLHERVNIVDKDINFRVTDLTPDPLFEGISEFTVYGGWAVKPEGSAVSLARTSKDSWIDLDKNNVFSPRDVTGSFAVAAGGTKGNGRFVVFGDDAIFQNHFLVGNNARLADNLAAWLTSH